MVADVDIFDEVAPPELGSGVAPPAVGPAVDIVVPVEQPHVDVVLVGGGPLKQLVVSAGICVPFSISRGIICISRVRILPFLWNHSEKSMWFEPIIIHNQEVSVETSCSLNNTNL